MKMIAERYLLNE